MFIGPTNKGKIPMGGDQFKNRLLLEFLSLNYDVDFLDSVNVIYNPKKLLNLIIKISTLKKYNRVILSLSTGSALKLIYAINFFNSNHSKLVYWVMGGGFGEFVNGRPNIIKELSKLRCIAIQTNILKLELEKVGLSNVIVVGNLKKFRLDKVHSRMKFIGCSNQEFPRFVFISRISREKGVDLIFEVASLIICECNFPFRVDFYGPIEKSYETDFLNKLSLNPSFQYCGYLDFFEKVEENYDFISSNYDVFLFPTFWKTEGFPGVIIDAMCSGLAVIASNWNSNKEVVDNETNGLLFESQNLQHFKECILRYYANTKLLSSHRIGSLNKARLMSYETIFEKYVKTLH